MVEQEMKVSTHQDSNRVLKKVLNPSIYRTLTQYSLINFRKTLTIKTDNNNFKQKVEDAAEISID